MLRAAFIHLFLLNFTMLKFTISCLYDPDVRHAILAAVMHSLFYFYFFKFPIKD